MFGPDQHVINNQMLKVKQLHCIYTRNDLMNLPDQTSELLRLTRPKVPNVFPDGGDPHKQGDGLAVSSRHNNTMFKRGFIMEKQMSKT